MIKRRKIIIPPFLLNTLTTNELMWLHTEAWNDSHFEYFAAKSQAMPLNINSLPIGYEMRRKNVPKLEGRWILENPHGTPKAYAEVHGIHETFTSFWVFVSEYGDGGSNGGWNDNALKDLSFLLSGILIVAEPDQLTLAPLQGSDLWEFSNVGWGKTKKFWSPYSEDFADLYQDRAGETVRTIEIIPSDWWGLDSAKLDKKALAYLEKRMLSKEFGSRFGRRSSFLQRLFSLKGLRKR